MRVKKKNKISLIPIKNKLISFLKLIFEKIS